METLTTRQQQVLELIRRHTERTGMPPTRAEIAAAMGFRSANAAEDHLRALARKGAIALTPGASRGVRVLASSPAPDRLPVIGDVAAGSPILAQQHISDHLRISPDIFRPRADYLLRVRGSSMRDAGILDRDLLAVHQTKEATNGQILVARVGDDVTVKRFRRRGNQVHLESANPDFEAIMVDLRNNEFTIEGLVVGVLRGGLRA